MTAALRYPIFIPSKGRADCQLTAQSLMAMKIPFRVVVEPCDLEAYARYISRSVLLVLPFENLGQGSIPARNWIWERAKEQGAARHWIIDDNVRGFYRMTLNRRIPCSSPAVFCAIEDFADRYTNIAFAGMNYACFAKDRMPGIPPFNTNTRVYSIILANTTMDYRWRGRYNEDTDICLRALKDGWCTVLFNAFLGNKVSTMTMKGGNTEHVYNTGDHRLAFAQSLAEQHPDCVEVAWKFGRWHHQVHYSAFKRNKLQLKQNVTPTREINEYNMVLRRTNGNGRADAQEW